MKGEKDFHRFVMEFAARHPDISVVIKTKSARHYLQSVEVIREEYFPKGLPNLTLTNAFRAEDLIQNSMAVLGYNSTTLIEGLLAGKNIISPDFSDLLPADSTDFFSGYEDILSLAHSSEELEQFILHPEERAANAARREEFLKKYIYFPDGRSSQRAEDEILKVLERK